MEGTRQTDQLIHRMRNILAEADTTDGTMPEADQGEESAPPVLLTSRSTHILLTEHLHPSFTDPPLAPSPYPSPYPSPSTRPDQPLWTPTICRVRNTPPPPSAVNQFDEMANGSPGTPEFNCEVPLILDPFNPLTRLSDSGLPGSLGSPMLDPFAIGEGG